MKRSGIYMISWPKGHYYIGSSIDLDRRWKQHANTLASGKHRNRHMQRVHDKYGPGRFEVLELCPPEDVQDIEQEHLDREFSEGSELFLNIATQAGGGAVCDYGEEWQKSHSEAMRKVHANPEWRKNLRESHKTPEYRKMMSNKLRKVAADPEWRKNNREAALRRSADPEWRKNNREANQRSAADPEWRRRHAAAIRKARAKPFRVTFPDGRVDEWATLKEASGAYGVSEPSLSIYLSGKQDPAKAKPSNPLRGCKFEYI